MSGLDDSMDIDEDNSGDDDDGDDSSDNDTENNENSSTDETEESRGARKKKKKRSSVYQYFTEVDSNVQKCKKCGKTYECTGGSTTTMHRHKRACIGPDGNNDNTSCFNYNSEQVNNKIIYICIYKCVCLYV